MDSNIVESPVESPVEKYTYEQILEMLGGNKYFSDNQILYTYNKLNGKLELAKHYLELCNEEMKAVNELYSKMKSPNELKEISNEI